MSATDTTWMVGLMKPRQARAGGEEGVWGGKRGGNEQRACKGLG